MALDPSIALQVKPLQLDNPMNAMAMYSQIQGNQQANQLNQMKMAEYERARTEDEGIRNYLAGVKDVNAPETRTGLLKFGKSGLEYGKALTEQQKAGVDRQAAETKLIVDRTKMSRDALDNVNTPEEYLAWHESNHRDPILGPALAARGVTADTSRANIMKQLSAPGGFEKLIQQSKLGAEKYIERTTQTAQEKATVGAKLRGQDLTNARARENIQLAKDRETRLATGGGEIKPLTELQTIKLRENVSKDYKSATTTLAQMDDLLDSIDAVKTAPGLSAATGYTGKYVPSFSEGKAAQAETRLANLRGKVTALGKATASMSGSIGAIANQEWKILSDQIAAIDEVKGKGPLLEQIALVEQQAVGAKDRVRDIYEKTRAEDFNRFPQFRDLPANRERGKPDAPAAAPNVVVTPDGQSHTFPTPAAAAQFKKAAGIQ